jgi:hypothetical protein
MSADNGCLAAFYLNRIADRRDTLFAQPLHLLFVMDERAEASHSVAAIESVFDHLDGSLDAKTKSVFVCQ